MDSHAIKALIADNIKQIHPVHLKSNIFYNIFFNNDSHFLSHRSQTNLKIGMQRVHVSAKKLDSHFHHLL